MKSKLEFLVDKADEELGFHYRSQHGMHWRRKGGSFPCGEQS